MMYLQFKLSPRCRLSDNQSVKFSFLHLGECNYSTLCLPIKDSCSQKLVSAAFLDKAMLTYEMEVNRSLKPFAQNLRFLIKIKASYT